MVLLSELSKDWYRPGEVGKMLGVSSRTVLNYRENGIFSMRLDQDTNRWYASRDEVIKLLKKKGLLYDDLENGIKVSIVYARVSSYDQKRNGDLSRQVQRIVDYLQNDNKHLYEIFTDVASGLNSNRSGLSKVIDRVMYGNVDKVYITYKDRLTRFGFEYLEKFFKYFGVGIVVLNDDEVSKSGQQELVEDMMSLIASFSGKLYGLRSSKKKKLLREIENIPEE